MNKQQIKDKLTQVQKQIPSDQQIWIPVKDFKGYQVSNYGVIKSLSKEIWRPAPTNKQTICHYFRKQKFIKPLKTGYGRKWSAVRLSVGLKTFKQFSLAKIILSSFLDIPLSQLPKNVYFKDHNSQNLKLDNLYLK